MKFSLTKPCKDCPFRTDNGFILRNDRVEEICEALEVFQQTFSCHKTTQHDDDGECIRQDGEIHCAGALIMLEHMDRPNQMMRIAERCGMYDRTKLDMDSPVFSNTDEMMDAYRERNRRAKS